jgi:hypothetical protein
MTRHEKKSLPVAFKMVRKSVGALRVNLGMTRNKRKTPGVTSMMAREPVALLRVNVGTPRNHLKTPREPLVSLPAMVGARHPPVTMSGMRFRNTRDN